jgi:hypothetical protein
VLGPPPPLHRRLVSGRALVACVGIGAWLAFTLPIPLVAPTGAAIGAVLGGGVVMLLLHHPRSGTHARQRRTR